MQIEKITCIQLRGKFPDFSSHMIMPDYGLPFIGTILSEAGYDIKIYVENIKPPEWDRIAESDLICFSLWNAAADKTFQLAKEIRSRLAIPIIIGGVYASYYPESCLDYCDYVVLGEGDETILELVESLAGGREIERVPGIAYRIGDQIHRTGHRPGPTRFETIPDFSLIEGYRRMSALDILVRRQKPVMTVQSSRGCPYNCTFCIVNTMFSGGYRTRDIESVIADLRDKRRYGRELVFVDNEFGADEQHAKELLQRMIQEDFGFDIVVFARVDVAQDDELLSLMRQAGIAYIFQGYESIQPETLLGYNKRQTVEQIERAISKLHSFGFHIWASFVLGGDNDTPEAIRDTVNFVREQELFNAYFWPLWGHFPERRSSHQTMIPWYRGIFRGWAYCDGHFVTHFPLQMSPSKLQRALITAYRTIYSPKQIVQALKRRKLVDAKSKTLLRYQWWEIEKEVQKYIPFLEEREDGLYDSEGRLREDLLVQRVQKDPSWTFQAGNRTIKALGLSSLELPIPGKRNITCVPPKIGRRSANEL